MSRISQPTVLVCEEHFELLEAQSIVHQILSFIRIQKEQLEATVGSRGIKWFERGEAIDQPWGKYV
jgi:hypothetical protein